MKPLSHEFAYQVLLLQAADNGRGSILFGDSFERARYAALPLLVGKEFPSVYLEHPLIGDPFLDVTVLYSKIAPNTRIDSDLTPGSDAMLDWMATHEGCKGLSCGYELDTKEAVIPRAAIHFQPRDQTQLVRPFCEAIGEPERADLYLAMQKRMPPGWPLSFFGLFRGRADSPMRVCGYMAKNESQSCANDPALLARRFDEIGFVAYDDSMLLQASSLMATASAGIDFQFDVYPDGSLGSVFAIDAQFGIEQPEAVRSMFESGPAAQLMSTLEAWGAADGRWKLGAEATFARALPVELDDGSAGRFTFTLFPQWVKARWSNGSLQPSKLYLLAKASLIVP